MGCGPSTSPSRGAATGIGNCEFSATLDVVEPMGMETMVFFTVDGRKSAAVSSPAAPRGPGEPMRLFANIDHMHLIDPQSGLVL